MIIIKIIGGLGNQLFQYAAARCLAERTGSEVKVDITGFKDYQLRNFDLTQFALNISVASPEEIDRYKAMTKWQRLQSYLKPASNRTFYKQPHFHFDPQFLQLGNNVYLQGFFQSEKYFHPIRENIRKAYQIKQSHIKNVIDLGRTLGSQSSVALHIRRGDYNNKEAVRYHGIIPISYYQQAVAYIKNNIQNPQFYLFTDDALWVKDNLQIEKATLISGRSSQTHFEDLYLMSQCQHNIIANSSFSWWGAWLNTNPDKIVIAPKQWFNEGPKDTDDLYPSGWIKM